MVIYLQQGDPSLPQGLASLGAGLGQYTRRQKEQSAINQALRGIGDQPDRMGIMQAAIEAARLGAPTEEIYGLARFFPQERPGAAPQDIAAMKETFTQLGLSPDESERYANLYGISPTGGQTEVVRKVADLISRQGGQMAGDSMLEPEMQEQPRERSQISSFIKENFQGLNPREGAQQQQKYSEKNEEARSEAAQKARKFEGTLTTLDRMSTLNSEGNFPATITRNIVLKKDGDLRFPEITDPTGRSQEYIKLVNGFMKDAKDYFGSRVTNFDLQSFKQMLPTLMNSSTGRERIINSMKIQTNIEKVLQDEIKNIYDEYGVRKLSRSQVEQLAEQRAEPKLEQLREQFKNQGVGGSVLMELNGKRGLVPSNKVETALKKGYKKV